MAHARIRAAKSAGRAVFSAKVVEKPRSRSMRQRVAGGCPLRSSDFARRQPEAMDLKGRKSQHMTWVDGPKNSQELVVYHEDGPNAKSDQSPGTPEVSIPY